MSIKDSTELCTANQEQTKERESVEDEVQLQEKKESDYEKLVEDDSDDNASKQGKSIRVDQIESKVEVKGVEEATPVKTPQRSVQQRRPSNVTDI
jgi:hypothetical protein|tara:strand:+ start:133 stop:417 length:285 start_codon:yes stop_codon:yes gene_type:complete